MLSIKLFLDCFSQDGDIFPNEEQKEYIKNHSELYNTVKETFIDLFNFKNLTAPNNDIEKMTFYAVNQLTNEFGDDFIYVRGASSHDYISFRVLDFISVLYKEYKEEILKLNEDKVYKRIQK